MFELPILNSCFVENDFMVGCIFLVFILGGLVAFAQLKKCFAAFILLDIIEIVLVLDGRRRDGPMTHTALLLIFKLSHCVFFNYFLSKYRLHLHILALLRHQLVFLLVLGLAKVKSTINVETVCYGILNVLLGFYFEQILSNLVPNLYLISQTLVYFLV